jgi:hypothetical protein
MNENVLLFSTQKKHYSNNLLYAMKNVSFTFQDLLENNVTRDMETFTYFRTPGTVLNDYYRIKKMQLADAAFSAGSDRNISVFGEIELKAQRSVRELEPCIF